MKFKINEARTVYKTSEYEELEYTVKRLNDAVSWLITQKALSSSEVSVIRKAASILSDTIEIHGLEYR